MSNYSNSVEAHINKVYRGDRSRCEIVTVDYAEIKCEDDFVRWAEAVFRFPDAIRKEEHAKNKSSKVMYLFGCMGRCVKHNVLVVERNRERMRAELSAFVEEAETMMSFHFSREYRHRVDFVTE